MFLLTTTFLLAHLSKGYSDPGAFRREEATTAVTAVSECHLHGTNVYCMAGATEYQIDTTATATGQFPAEYTGCHNHGTDLYCIDEDGNDVELLSEDAEDTTDTDAESEDSDSDSEEMDCHFHAGVEHCVKADGSDAESSTSCERVDRDYNIGLRIGMLFVVLASSSLGVFGPILLSSFTRINPSNIILIVLKQFGTGVIISTAFVHLFTHAFLMFDNSCLGTLKYEATTAAIFMGGLFLAFVVEFAAEQTLARQVAKARGNEAGSTSSSPATGLDDAIVENKSRSHLRSVEMMNIYILEAGIVFHSILIGLTLVVAGDSYFITLTIVILFHQMFEGVALGTRIAALGTGRGNMETHLHLHSHDDADKTAADVSALNGNQPPNNTYHVPLFKKLVMAAVFALVTPVGMAIGIGVLDVFNGNDPQTIIAIGTLDALSAGVLAWVGVVEMWAGDWMNGGEMTRAGAPKMLAGGLAFVIGMVIMSLLGKWA